MYNKKFQNRFLKKKALKDDDEPLVIEYVPSDDEWMVGEDVVEGTSTNVDMSQPSGSHQVGEKRKRNTKRKEEKKREIVVAGLIKSAAPLAVGTDTFARRRRLQLQSDTVVVVALVRRSRYFCSSTLLPLLVNAVTFTRRHRLQLPVS
ncbi:hypothetical protein LWI29_034456 [Acer saccharum]|uniref:Uncharacterized protein n=1 Tax=Acer saccharum TaxID=4024 RepID=A0AA39TGF2_ACESA|nr:hypothetical protein LWI29_034456 [Acer saccharum]